MRGPESPPHWRVVPWQRSDGALPLPWESILHPKYPCTAKYYLLNLMCSSTPRVNSLDIECGAVQWKLLHCIWVNAIWCFSWTLIAMIVLWAPQGLWFPIGILTQSVETTLWWPTLRWTRWPTCSKPSWSVPSVEFILSYGAVRCRNLFELILNDLFSEDPLVRRNICKKQPLEESLVEVIFLVPGTESLCVWI